MPEIPDNFPHSVMYTSLPVLSEALSRSALSLHFFSEKTKPAKSSATSIKKIHDPKHPAYNQYGLYATRDLLPGQLIVDYVGLYHLPDPSDSSSTSDYDLSLRHTLVAEDGTKTEIHAAIDASSIGNEARMINDYRRIKAVPNARFDSYLNAENEIRMGIFVDCSQASRSQKKNKNGSRNTPKSLQCIKEGEEILVSYGKRFWSAREAEQRVRNRENGGKRLPSRVLRIWQRLENRKLQGGK